MSNNKKKVLITGGAGFIGSHTAEKFLKNNFKVIVLDNLSGGNLININHLKKSIAFKVMLQPQDKTFTDREIENFSNKIIDLIATSYKGELRQ